MKNWLRYSRLKARLNFQKYTKFMIKTVFSIFLDRHIFRISIHLYITPRPQMSQIFSVIHCCLGFSHLPCYNWDFETLCFQYPPPLPLLQYLLCQLQYCQLRQVSSLELLLMSPTCSVTNNTYLCKELYFTKEKHLNSLNMILYSSIH